MLSASLFTQQLGLIDGGFSWPAILLAILGVGLISVGLLKRRFINAYSTVAILAANTIVLLLCVECAALTWNFAAGTTAYHGTQNASADEVSQTTVQQALYVGWKGQPFSGKNVNISADGLRFTPLTAAPTAEMETGAIKVFAFGGSTMWGEGASDNKTIPAHLQRMLTDQCQHPVKVTNYGQRAWVSTQSFMQLVTEIQKGIIPDVVVFYDGYNEVAAAYATGEFGVPENFDGMTTFGSTTKATLRKLAKNTESGKLFSSLRQRPTPAVDVESTSEGVVQTYLSVLRLTEALGKEYGFEVQFYWQPQFYTDTKVLTPKEAALSNHPWLPKPVQQLTTVTYTKLKQAADEHPALTDISDCFDGETQRIYLDPCHITGAGNKIVGQSMLDNHLLETVRQKIAAK